VTPLFKQCLRVILFFCEFKTMLNTIVNYKGAMDVLVGNILGGIDNMLNEQN
jgi:hypothetical protein